MHWVPPPYVEGPTDCPKGPRHGADDSTGLDTPAPGTAEDPSPGKVAAAAAHPSDLPTLGQHHTSSFWKLTLGSIGVVYGDIGTSPIYTVRESLHAASGDGLTRADVRGCVGSQLGARRFSMRAQAAMVISASELWTRNS